MRRFALFGHPVGHSQSPGMQRAAFEASGLDWTYEAVDIRSDELHSAGEQLRSGVWDGANVTIPHKQAMLNLVDDLADSAALTSAVNAIVRDGDRLIGHNTDMPAFLHDLHAHFNFPAQGSGLILGSGGAARAVAFGLAGRGMNLFLIARSGRAAADLAADLIQAYSIGVEVLPWEVASFPRIPVDCTLIVNATPVGMRPHVQESPWPADVPLPGTTFVYDLIYAPRETKFTREAQKAGHEAVSGAGMLVEQGALSFELWTGLHAPREAMRTALELAMERSQSGSSEREVLNA